MFFFEKIGEMQSEQRRRPSIWNSQKKNPLHFGLDELTVAKAKQKKTNWQSHFVTIVSDIEQKS